MSLFCTHHYMTQCMSRELGLVPQAFASKLFLSIFCDVYVSKNVKYNFRLILWLPRNWKCLWFALFLHYCGMCSNAKYYVWLWAQPKIQRIPRFSRFSSQECSDVFEDQKYCSKQVCAVCPPWGYEWSYAKILTLTIINYSLHIFKDLSSGKQKFNLGSKLFACLWNYAADLYTRE